MLVSFFYSHLLGLLVGSGLSSSIYGVGSSRVDGWQSDALAESDVWLSDMTACT